MLDEPTASLPADEVARLFAALRRLREQGVGMIYVSHRLDEVFEIADRMVVLRDGQVAGERVVAETTPDETILLIVGREPSQVFRRPGGTRRRAAAGVRPGAWFGGVGPIDASIHAGEIVGLVGLRGAGQETVGRALFGMEPVSGGASLLDGAGGRDRFAARGDGASASISSAPTGSANRSCPDLTVRENFFLNPLAAGRPLSSWLSPRARERGVARSSARRSACDPTIPTSPSNCCPAAISRRSSSGAGCICKSKVYVFEDPTAGVDVGAKAEIYQLFDLALQAGAAILIVSTDFEEVAKVCHRALVFDRGRVRRASCTAADLSISNLLAAASASIATSASPPTPH